ncbi:uncharacterized protein LOC112087291 [Eutrema salsugineum]|uniref:uncharacterized protein LOC112087291 n=1 Tax=Eutrema salsugineum TaxID=72664 RepID=UPI000CECFD7B|nr:uncharacterized protein LOC112087291 [Eutrema salsugineum]
MGRTREAGSSFAAPRMPQRANGKACASELKGKSVAASAKAKGKAIATTSRAQGKQKRAERSSSEELSEEEDNVASPAPVPQKKKKVIKKTEPKSVTYNEHLKKLQAVSHEGTMYPDVELLRKIGIYEQVKAVLDNIGLGNIMEVTHESYKELTCQFLASLQVNFYNTDGPAEVKDGFGSLEFKSGQERYEMTFREVCECFGFKIEGKCSAKRLWYPMNKKR